ncbi:MAG: FAD:protein FMN transferase, partial [Prosthecobacter sp.]|nr:FAD:protein FMN transferase [Prosthecobacter sp.]
QHCLRVVLRVLSVLYFSVLSVVGAELARYDFSGPGMGTLFRIACYAPDQAVAEAAVELCFKRVSELNARFTDYDPHSELMRLCAQDASMPAKVSDDLYDLLKRAYELAELTQGAFDPTCGHLSHLWRRTRRTGKLPTQERLAHALAVTGWRRMRMEANRAFVSLAPGTLLDLGGIAKGRAVDECMRLLRAQGLTRAIVQAGGDTLAGEPPPGQDGWEVLLRTGHGEEKRIRLMNRAVSTSGDLHQFIEIEGIRYSHILSPRTGLGLTERVACSVTAPDCTTTDALATAMCVLGEAAGTRLARSIPSVEVRFTRPTDGP